MYLFHSKWRKMHLDYFLQRDTPHSSFGLSAKLSLSASLVSSWSLNSSWCRRVSRYLNRNPHNFKLLFGQIIEMLQDLYIFYFDLSFSLGTFRGQNSKFLFIPCRLSPWSGKYFSSLKCKMFSNIAQGWD